MERTTNALPSSKRVLVLNTTAALAREAQRAANAWDAVTFKQMVMAAITALHGVVGAAETVDLLKFSSVSPATASTSPIGSGAVGAEAILRVPAPYASWY